MTANPSFADEALALVEFIESDFGCSGPPVRFEAIKCALEAAYARGKRDVQVPCPCEPPYCMEAVVKPHIVCRKRSGRCPHGFSKGMCGDPVCIPFNAGLSDASH